jgi:hypothetical protein
MSADFPVRPYVARDVSPAPAATHRFALNPPYVHGRPFAPREIEELPSIREFLDDAPPIEQFAPHSPSHTPPPAPLMPSAPPALPEGDWPPWGGETPTPAQPVADEWARADWQSYDWRSAANLGTAAPDAAAEAWASTDWNEPGGSRQSRQSAAEALARALDQISHRIRAGELRVPGSETVQDDAAIAATLAALLGIRR